MEIGRANINRANGLVTVAFNNSTILTDKSNIHGWISLSANCGNTLGPTDMVVGWDGNIENKISVKVIDPAIGENLPAKLNKYVRSGTVGSQPIVQQDANGKFFVTFSIELLLSKNYSDLTLTDTVYAGMEVDSSSIKVISRPRDGSI